MLSSGNVAPIKMERVRTMTIANWDALAAHHDDDADADADAAAFAAIDGGEDDRFFESFDRISSAVSLDLDASSSSSSSSSDDDFDDCRLSFASAVSSVHPSAKLHSLSAASPDDYDVWMAAPGSITERRKRLLQGMGLAADRHLSRLTSLTVKSDVVSKQAEGDSKREASNSASSPSPLPSPLRMVLVRSRSEGDIESFSVERQRKVDVVGSVSKQRLTRTYSAISAPMRGRIVCPSLKQSGSSSSSSDGRLMHHHSAAIMSSVLSASRFGAFFLIKNLDTGKEFIVNEYGEDGTWNRLSDLQTGKQLTMEEFEKCVGYSPVVKELMRRENVSRISGAEDGSRIAKKGGGSFGNSYIYKSLRMSKRRGVALIKSGIKGVAHSVSGLICEKDQVENPMTASAAAVEQKPGKNSSPSSSSGWIKVRQSGKSHKELSALHLCQEIQAHEGSIWAIKFSCDARLLASAGEDRVVHVWEVQECEVMEAANHSNGNINSSGAATPLYSAFCPSPVDRPQPSLSDLPAEKKSKKGKGASGRRSGGSSHSVIVPDYVHVPETVFALSEKPVCSFKGHLDDVLDLSWSRSQLLLSSSMDKTVRLWDLESKSCLKLFAHNDYVTCIQFNPMNDDYFISGSLDAKVRIWSIPDRQVVDWTDLHEMVTAACYTPDGQGAFIGSHKGNIRIYSADDCKLSQTCQIDFQNKKSNAKKITGFQFSPTNPTEVLVTSADSRVRILDGHNLVHKFRGFRNTSSQIAASFSQDGKYVISASEDSQVYVWKREEHRHSSASAKRSMVNTRSFEQFQCRDVSVAIPWPGTVKGEPPAPPHSKRYSKRSSTQPLSACGSPTRDQEVSSFGAHSSSKRHLPPLPAKTAAIASEKPLEEDQLAQISETAERGGLGESFNSESASTRYGDSPLISASSAAPSSSWSSSWSLFDTGGGHGSHTVQATAWGLVVVTAGLDGAIRAYQNFGVPQKVGRQANLFGGPT